MAKNRLFLMVYLLLEKGTATAPELARHFEVSVRTIYRDIDTLSAAGFPVYASQGKGGGIFLQENFVLNKSLISEQEQRQLLMSLQGMGIVDEENTQSLLSRLGNLFQKQNVNWIEVDYSEWNRTTESTFHILKHAIFQSKKVSFTYYGAKGEPASRTAEPLKLIFKGQEWYLYGYCCLRGDCRLFKLTRIKELLITEEQFQRSAPRQVFQQLEPHRDRLLSLTLLFERTISCRVYDHFDNVSEREDGRFLVEASMPQNEWLYCFLLSFGDQVEVLYPESVRQEIKARIKRMQNKYQT